MAGFSGIFVRAHFLLLHGVAKCCTNSRERLDAVETEPSQLSRFPPIGNFRKFSEKLYRPRDKVAFGLPDLVHQFSTSAYPGAVARFGARRASASDEISKSARKSARKISAGASIFV
jgi:hypothetical protein